MLGTGALTLEGRAYCLKEVHTRPYSLSVLHPLKCNRHFNARTNSTFNCSDDSVEAGACVHLRRDKTSPRVEACNQARLRHEPL